MCSCIALLKQGKQCALLTACLLLLQTALKARELGGSTLEELDRQGKKLELIEGDLNEVCGGAATGCCRPGLLLTTTNT